MLPYNQQEKTGPTGRNQKSTQPALLLGKQINPLALTLMQRTIFNCADACSAMLREERFELTPGQDSHPAATEAVLNTWRATTLILG